MGSPSTKAAVSRESRRSSIQASCPAAVHSSTCANVARVPATMPATINPKASCTFKNVHARDAHHAQQSVIVDRAQVDGSVEPDLGHSKLERIRRVADVELDDSGRTSVPSTRSEEHTSELQSPCNI